MDISIAMPAGIGSYFWCVFKRPWVVNSFYLLFDPWEPWGSGFGDVSLVMPHFCTCQELGEHLRNATMLI